MQVQRWQVATGKSMRPANAILDNGHADVREEGVWDEFSLPRACSWLHEVGMPALVPIILTYLLTLLTSRGGVIHDDVHSCDVNMMGHLTLITVRCLLQKSSIPHSVLIIVSCGWRRRVHGMLCHFYTCTLHFN